MKIIVDAMGGDNAPLEIVKGALSAHSRFGWEIVLTVDEAAIRGQQRDRTIVRGRQVAMYLIRRMSNYSYKDIGKEFGDRDHTTVMHSIEQVEQRMKKDSTFAETVRDITSNISAKK